MENKKEEQRFANIGITVHGISGDVEVGEWETLQGRYFRGRVETKKIRVDLVGDGQFEITLFRDVEAGGDEVAHNCDNCASRAGCSVTDVQEPERVCRKWRAKQ